MVIGRYVTLDPRDNSVEFSKKLLRTLRSYVKKDLRVVAFKVKDSEDYGFIVSPEGMGIDESVQYPTIQYNDKTGKYGFDCFNPSVNQMLYSWGLPFDKVVRCKVRVRVTSGKAIFVIKKPA